MKYDDESMIFLLVASSLMEFLCEWNHPALRMGTFCESHGVLSVLGKLWRTFFSLHMFLFPCATLFCGQVILDLLSRIGVLSDEKVKVIFIDTFHLFPETHQFLSELEVNIPTLTL